MAAVGAGASLPSSSSRPAGIPSFFQAPDPFAGISYPKPKDGNTEGDDDSGALNFEDTYDGLGDALDDADDALNEDTFGIEEAEVSQASVGRDFDFFGQTAKVSNAINEEHLRFNRQAPAPRALAASSAPPLATSATAVQSKSVRTGYEKYGQAGSSGLKITASVWGVASKNSTPDVSFMQQENKPAAATAPAPAKKMMSLEEVEAAMLARKGKNRASAQEQSTPAPVSQPSVERPQHSRQAESFDQPPVQHATQPTQAPVRTSDFDFRALHPIPSQGISLDVQPQPQFPRLVEVPPPRQAPKLPVQPPAQPRSILLNPNRHPVQPMPVPMAFMPPMPQYQVHLPLQGPIVPGGLPHSAPSFPLPQHLRHLSDDQRVALLAEEAKRAKRNHKIHLLSKDNGLMTPQDKNFVTRIQLQQLVSAAGNPNDNGTDDALAEDFYYQVHSHIRRAPRSSPQQPLNQFAQTYLLQTGVRQGGAGGRRLQRGGDSHVLRMEQQVQRAVEVAKLRPKSKQIVLEGTLGKISFSNSKTPKPLLNIKRAEGGSDNNGRPQVPSRAASDRRSQPYSGGARHRQESLRQIEDVYVALMRMEDHERCMPPQQTPDGNRAVYEQWTQEMKRLNQRLWEELKVLDPIVPNSPVPHPFIAFLSFGKGKKAVPRIFRLIDNDQRVTIMTMIVVHIGVLDVVRRGQLRPDERQLPSAVRDEVELFSQAVLPSLFSYVSEAELNIIIGLLGILLDSADVQRVARSKVGLGILAMLLSRAELIKQSDNAPEDDWSQWTDLYSRLFDLLEPVLGHIFPTAVNAGEDIYVWQFLAALGLGANLEQQQRLVMVVKDRVLETVNLSRTLPPDMASQRLSNVNLFMHSLGLDVDLLS